MDRGSDFFGSGKILGRVSGRERWLGHKLARGLEVAEKVLDPETKRRVDSALPIQEFRSRWALRGCDCLREHLEFLLGFLCVRPMARIFHSVGMADFTGKSRQEFSEIYGSRRFVRSISVLSHAFAMASIRSTERRGTPTNRAISSFVNPAK